MLKAQLKKMKNQYLMMAECKQLRATDACVVLRVGNFFSFDTDSDSLAFSFSATKGGENFHIKFDDSEKVVQFPSPLLFTSF